MEIEAIIKSMREHGMSVPNRSRFAIPNAEASFTEVYAKLLDRQGKSYVPQPEYGQVVDWLTDNGGKGLFMYGACGRGKSYIARYVIPALFLTIGKVFSIYDMPEANKRIDEVKSRALVVLDDLGTEYDSVEFGQRRNAFDEIVDNAEKQGNLLVITSNLSGEQLLSKYGERSLERIKSTTKRILFKGDSLRG